MWAIGLDVNSGWREKEGEEKKKILSLHKKKKKKKEYCTVTPLGKTKHPRFYGGDRLSWNSGSNTTYKKKNKTIITTLCSVKALFDQMYRC